MLFRAIAIFLLMLVLPATHVEAAKRVALLIGNQDYRINSLDLKNPHNDVAAIGKALKSVGFKVRIVKDAGFGKLQKEVNRYTKRLRAAGKDAVGFFYYSGHGALNEQDRFNYLIPTDVDTIDSADLWDGSVRLKRIVDDLKDKASNAVHFVVFDACRNELKLASKNSKSLRQSKGFKPIQERVRGMLIAYATAEGEIASDVGQGVGPYAEALAAAIVKPGVEAVNMFREVQVSVFNNIGQEPWYTHGALKRVYLAGQQTPAPVVAPSAVASAWAKLKTSQDEVALRAFADRHKGTMFAELALGRIALNRLHKQSMNSIRETSKPNNSTILDNANLASLSRDQGRCDGVDVKLNTGKSVCIKPGSGKSFKDCPTCPEMVVAPAGSFVMGSNDGDGDEKPVRKVTIGAPLAVGKFEVTFAEWDACVADGGCSHKPGDEGWGRGKQPVINVSWDDITKQYLPWLARKTGKTYRLLTEAEWEYVARARTTTEYSWGDKIGKGNAVCSGCGSQWDNKQTALVGSFKANGFGLHDMHGNVWEWVQDCYKDSYRGAPADGSAVSTGKCESRVLRGGSWNDYPQDLRSALRGRGLPVFRLISDGFRVVRMLTP